MKKNKEVIDIILPNYNSEKFISHTIRSIINQSYKYWKLIIVDDASNKKTKLILNKFSKLKKIKIYWLKKNKGAGHCRNYALKKSNSNFIAFIDSDDIWAKNKLRNQISFMKEKNYSFTYTNYKTFGTKEKEINCPQNINYNNFIKNTTIATSTMMIRRDQIKGIKFSYTKICEDYFFKCKLLKKTKFAYCLNQILTKYRIRKDSLQGNNLKNFYWIWKINRDFNKLTFLKNLNSLFFITLNSLKKYGGKNIFNILH